jgi:hypothetical protein
MPKTCFSIPFFLIFFFLSAREEALRAKEILVESGARLVSVLSSAVPGDEFVLKSGVYSGGIWLQQLHGARDRPIVIRSEKPDNPAVILGGQENLKLSSCSWIVIDGLHLIDSYDNGLNIDDVARGAQVERSHHIVLRNLVVKDSGYELNSDGLKLSGCDDTLIENCKVIRWSRDGCAIDMMRCQRIMVEGCELDGCRWSLIGMQAKGGSSNITFRRCKVQGVITRGIQVGGSSSVGLVWPPTADYEAAKIELKACEVVEGEASVTVVNAKSVRIEDCRFIRPTRWFFRLLPESEIKDVVQSQDIEVRGNSFLIHRSMVGVMNTKIPMSSRTIRFIDNAWYCPELPRRTVRSELAFYETGGIYGIDPVKRRFQGRILDVRSASELQAMDASRKARYRSIIMQTSGGLIGFSVAFATAWFFTRPIACRCWKESTTNRSRWLRLNLTPFGLLASFLALYAGIPLADRNNLPMGLPSAIAAFQSSSWYPLEFETVKWLFSAGFAFLAMLSVGILVPQGRSSIGHASHLMIPAVLLILSVPVIDLLVAGFWGSSKPPEKSHFHAVLWGVIAAYFLLLFYPGARDRIAPNSEPIDRGSSPLDLACAVMAIRLVYQRAMPFDFSSNFRDIFYKLESQLIAVVPDFRFAGDILYQLWHNGPMVFLGIACSVALTANAEKVRPIKASVVLLIGCILLLESTQLMLPNGSFSSANAIIDLVFGLVGIGLAHSLIARHPWLSARPDASLLGNRIRWALRLLSFLGVVALLPILLGSNV